MWAQAAAQRVTLRLPFVSVLIVLTLGCAAPGLQGGKRAQPAGTP